MRSQLFKERHKKRLFKESSPKHPWLPHSVLCPRRVATAAEEDRMSSASNPYFVSIKLSDLHVRDYKASPNSKHTLGQCMAGEWYWRKPRHGGNMELLQGIMHLCMLRHSFWEPFSLLLWFGSCISKVEYIKNGCCLKLTDDIFIPNQCRDLIFSLKNIVYLSNTHTLTHRAMHISWHRPEDNL